jgi:hypothetical protein
MPLTDLRPGMRSSPSRATRWSICNAQIGRKTARSTACDLRLALARGAPARSRAFPQRPRRRARRDRRDRFGTEPSHPPADLRVGRKVRRRHGRLLTPPEIRQIAGRAGRYGLHEEGQVTRSTARVRILRESIERFDPRRSIARSGSRRPTSTCAGSPRSSARRASRGCCSSSKRACARRRRRPAHRRPLRDDRSRVALEMSDKFLELPLAVRCTYAARRSTRAATARRARALGRTPRDRRRRGRRGVAHEPAPQPTTAC